MSDERSAADEAFIHRRREINRRAAHKARKILKERLLRAKKMYYDAQSANTALLYERRQLIVQKRALEAKWYQHEAIGACSHSSAGRDSNSMYPTPAGYNVSPAAAAAFDTMTPGRLRDLGDSSSLLTLPPPSSAYYADFHNRRVTAAAAAQHVGVVDECDPSASHFSHEKLTFQTDYSRPSDPCLSMSRAPDDRLFHSAQTSSSVTRPTEQSTPGRTSADDIPTWVCSSQPETPAGCLASMLTGYLSISDEERRAAASSPMFAELLENTADWSSSSSSSTSSGDEQLDFDESIPSKPRSPIVRSNSATLLQTSLNVNYEPLSIVHVDAGLAAAEPRQYELECLSAVEETASADREYSTPWTVVTHSRPTILPSVPPSAPDDSRDVNETFGELLFQPDTGYCTVVQNVQLETTTVSRTNSEIGITTASTSSAVTAADWNESSDAIPPHVLDLMDEN